MSGRLRIGLLLAVGVLAYVNTLPNGFVGDDGLYVVHNRAVTSPSLRAFFAANEISSVFRPLTFASFAANWWVAQGAWSFHAINLLLHAAVCVLLYLLLGALLEGLPEAGSVAFAAALLFAVHPIHTEAVAWVVGRAELLAAAFLFAAWLLHLRERAVAMLVCFAAALLAKESAVVFLPMVLLCDYARGEFKPIARYGWMAGLTGLYLAVLWKVQGGRFGAHAVSVLDNPLGMLPAKLRILNALRVAWKYVGLQAYPAALSCDYSYDAITLYANWAHLWLACAAAPGVVGFWVWAVGKKRVAWGVAGALYFLGFAVTANVLILTGTIMGERLAYLPSAGFCLLAALLWNELAKKKQVAAWALLAVLVVGLGARTVARNRDWHDNWSLFTAGLRAEPGSAKMHAAVAGEYMLRGEDARAEAEYQSALEIWPDYIEATTSLGLLKARQGQDEEALRRLKRALALSEKGSPMYETALASVADELTKVNQDQQALALLDRGIAESPGYAALWSSRAAIHYKSGETELARSDAEAALRLEPGNEQAQDVLRRLPPDGSAVR